jgi:hypothetical protein
MILRISTILKKRRVTELIGYINGNYTGDNSHAVISLTDTIG